MLDTRFILTGIIGYSTGVNKYVKLMKETTYKIIKKFEHNRRFKSFKQLKLELFNYIN